MIRNLLALLWPIGLLASPAAGPAAAAPSAHLQTLFFHAIFTLYRFCLNIPRTARRGRTIPVGQRHTHMETHRRHRPLP